MKRPVAVSVEAKRAALARIAKGEAASVVAADLGIHRQRLHDWQARVRESGRNALRGPGRPPKPMLHRPLPRRSNAVFIAAVQELVARLARTTGEPSATVHTRSAEERESGALIPTRVAGSE